MSDSGPHNIFSLNKKLNDSLMEIDTRFKTLEKTIELGHVNTNGRIEKIEQRLDKIETRNTNIEKIVIQIQKTLNSQVRNQEDPKEPKEKSVQKEEKFESIKRDNQGRIQLSDFQNTDNLTISEKFVKRAWPEAIFPRDIQDDAYASVKNKVVLKPEWRLVVANVEIFDKLLLIQNALQMALIPYHMWAKRVAMDMGGDFHGVRVWSSGRNLTWIELLEAIFTTMQRLNVLHSPFTTFSLIIPNKNESPHAFAWRLREAFYKLSGIDRDSDSTRELLKELIMNHLPRIWTLTYQNIKSSNNYEIIEMAVQMASQVVKWSTEDAMPLTNTIEPPKNIIPHLESPSFPNSEENSFLVNNGTCYNCGKRGHWANNCPKPQNNNSYSNNTTTNNNHKSALTWNKDKQTNSPNKYSELRRKLARFRGQKQSGISNLNRKTQRSYLINENDIDSSLDPIGRLEENDFEQDLSSLLEELELHEDNE